MGKGDVKTKRGKIINGSFGVSRPHKAKKAEAVIEEKAADVVEAPEAQAEEQKSEDNSDKKEE